MLKWKCEFKRKKERQSNIKQELKLSYYQFAGKHSQERKKAE